MKKLSVFVLFTFLFATVGQTAEAKILGGLLGRLFGKERPMRSNARKPNQMARRGNQNFQRCPKCGRSIPQNRDRSFDDLHQRDDESQIVSDGRSIFVQTSLGPSSGLHGDGGVSFGDGSILQRPVDPRPMDNGGLNPSGLGGNPAFQIATAVGGGAMNMCQATLIRRENQQCQLITAAHCVEDGYRDNQGNLVIDTHSSVFGRIRAKAILPASYTNPASVRMSGVLTEMQQMDIALLVFEGEKCTNSTNVPVVPLSQQQLKPGDQVEWGSKWFKGLYPAIVKESRGLDWVNGRFVPTFTRTDIQVPSPITAGIYEGDSGGPLLVKDASGQQHVVGVLSTRDPDSHRNAHYSTMASLQFIQQASDAAVR